MGIFTEIRNHCLIRELQKELNTDVLLLGFDGHTFFGNLQAIDDCRIAVLTPAIEAKTSSVEILTAGGELVEVEFARVDLFQIVAKATSIAHDPFDSPKHDKTDGPSKPHTKTSEDDQTERQESHHLIRQLVRMVGDDVTITTLGGFLFEGKLTDVDDELAVLTVADIFVPGTTSSLPSTNVRSVVVNLEALTSVSGSTT